MQESGLLHRLLNYPISDTAGYKKIRSFLERHPRATRALTRIIIPFEKAAKVPVFHCHMCGQCVLHYTGFTCPMNCPKNLRNGPCGGVRLNGHCEVEPERECTWVAAYRRSQALPWPHEFHHLRPPVDWTLSGSSSWINYLTGRDFVAASRQMGPKSALEVLEDHQTKEGEGAR